MTATATFVSPMKADDSNTYQVSCLLVHNLEEVITARVNITISGMAIKKTLHQQQTENGRNDRMHLFRDNSNLFVKD